MKKYIGLLLAALLLLSLPLTIFAEGTDWSFEENYSKLTDGERIYKRHPLPSGCEFNPDGTVYVKNEDLEHIAGYTTIIKTDASDSIVYAVDYYSYMLFDVYTAKDTEKTLMDFYNGNYSKYRVRYFVEYEYDFDYYYLDLSDNVFESLENRRTLSVDVSELLYSDAYEVLGFDATDCISHVCGAVYTYNDNLYYVDYDSLDNSYFTSDGAFSYRSGKVDMMLIENDNELANAVGRIKDDGELRMPEYIYENGGFNMDFGAASGAFFWVGIVFCGYVLPCIPFIFGLILPHTKKHGYTKRWYVLSVLGLIWMALTTAIILILIL